MIHKEEKLENILESLLFAYGEEISIKKLSEITKKSKNELIIGLENLKKSLLSRGIRLISKEEKYQLVANKTCSEYIEKLIKSEIQEELTPASLEVLAIVAYRGPVSKNQIESIRGVNSSYALRNLALRGLIEKDIVDRSLLYRISLSALRKFGIDKIEDLPQYKELNQETVRIEKILEQ